jgi:hypothetical protein
MLDSLERTHGPNALKYQSRHFNHVSHAIGKALWDFLVRAESIAQMEAATSMERAAVEALSEPLIAEFGIEIDQREAKQVVGHMVKQIMESLGYEPERKLRITRPGLFTSGLAFRRSGTSRDRSAPVTKEGRRARLSTVQGDAFGAWFDSQVRAPDRTVDPDRLAELVCQWNIEIPLKTHGKSRLKTRRNFEQLVLTARILLRKFVPASEYESEEEETVDEPEES